MAKSIVLVKGKGEKTFVINEQVKITKGKTDLAFADFKAGMSAMWSTKKDGDKLSAIVIKVSAPMAAPKAK